MSYYTHWWTYIYMCVCVCVCVGVHILYDAYGRIHCIFGKKSNSSVSWWFLLTVSSRTTSVHSYALTVNSRFYSIISQILMLHKTRGNRNKFDCTKSLRICGWMGHWLRYIKFKLYVKKKTIAPRVICYIPLSSRQAATSTRSAEMGLFFY